MTDQVKFLKKIIRIREHLVRNNTTGKPMGMVLPHLKKVKNWVEFYPQASKEGAIRFFEKNQKSIWVIMPGKSCPSRQQLEKELTSLFMSA